MTPVAVSVGTFDGVHRGHRRLLATAAEEAAARGLELVVVTLDRHPLSLLRPERAPRLLTGLDHKLELLAGIDGVARTEVLVFDRPRADQSPASFVRDTLAGDLGARLLVVGGNFRFGRAGAGDVALAEQLGSPLGLTVIGLPLLEGAPGSVISSSEIRRLVAAGSLARATDLLGRPHEVRGRLAPDGEGPDALPLVLDPRLLVPPPGLHRVLAGPLAGPDEPRDPATVAVAADAAGDGPSLVLTPAGPPPGWWRPGAPVRVAFPGSPAAGPATPARPGADREAASR